LAERAEKSNDIDVERIKEIIKKLLLDLAEGYKESKNIITFGALLADLRINFASLAIQASNLEQDKLLPSVLAILIHEFFWLQVYFKKENMDFIDEFMNFIIPIKKMANEYHEKLSVISTGEEKPKYIG
jgi:hypothetical protein